MNFPKNVRFEHKLTDERMDAFRQAISEGYSHHIAASRAGWSAYDFVYIRRSYPEIETLAQKSITENKKRKKGWG